MDPDAVRKKRQEELDEKRKRLEEMKKARQERVLEPVQTQLTPLPSPVAAASHINRPLPLPPTVQIAAPVVQTEKKLLTTCKNVCKINILPVDIVTYSKETQTDTSEDDFKYEIDRDFHPHFGKASVSFGDRERDREPTISRSAISRPGSVRIPKGALNLHSVSTPTTSHGMSDETKHSILTNKSFGAFLKSSSLFVERALEQTRAYDIFHNYADDSDSHAAANKEQVFDFQPAFEDESIRHRPVMDVRFSPHSPELFLVAYGAKMSHTHAGKSSSLTSGGNSTALQGGGSDENSDNPGVVYLWSKELHARPEFKFTSASPVLNAAFHPTDSHVVLGGCYNGQVVLWDMREAKTNATQRSSMSGKGHKHPICAMQFSNNVSCELVTISTDGMLCYWDTSRLTEPLSVAFLNAPQASLQFDETVSSPRAGASTVSNLNISTMSFGHTMTAENLLFGCGSGRVLRYNLPHKAADAPLNQSSAHYGLVTSIHPHPATQSKKYKALVLTSSLDWTVKLWTLDNFTTPLLEFTTTSYDYISDVQWSPVHPTVFCTVSSGGALSLWNLSKSTTVPIDSVDLFAAEHEEKTQLVQAGSSKVLGKGIISTSVVRTLNKIVWSADGSVLLAGDSLGTIHVVRVNSGVFALNSNEDSNFESVVLANAKEAANSGTSDGF